MSHRIYNKSILVLIMFFLNTSASKAQSLNLTTIHIAQSLLYSGIDTVLIYSPYRCPMAEMMTDTSAVDDISYIVTKRADQLYIERLTDEYVYKEGRTIKHNLILRKDSQQIFNFLHKNFNSIISDTLLPGMVKENFDGKDTLLRFQSDHPCYVELIIVTKSGRYINRMINEDLTDGVILNMNGSFRRKRESPNYKHNISTSIYKIISMLQTEEEEIKKVFYY